MWNILTQDREASAKSLESKFLKAH